MFATYYMQCPNCNDDVHCTEPDSELIDDNVIQQSTDLVQYYDNLLLPPQFAHTCRNCGFSGWQLDFESKLTDKLRKFVNKEITPAFKKHHPISASMRMLFAAQIRSRHPDFKHLPHQIGNIYLLAAHCAEIEGADEFAWEMRTEAKRLFIRASEKHLLMDCEYATYAYLAGEQARRMGQPDADMWYQRALQSNPSAELDAIITSQLVTPREFV